MAGVSIRNSSGRSIPLRSSLLQNVAKDALAGWDISLVFATPREAKALNTKLRRKTYVPNVLSYEVGSKSGEIIMCPVEAKRQASSYDLSYSDFTLYLFIHALLHLKGWGHGATMEQCEQKLMTKWASVRARPRKNEAADSNGHRHRDVPGKSRRRRGNR